MEKIILKNGFTIYIDNLPNVHSFSIDLCIRAGSKYGKESAAGITHFLEHMHFRKLDNYSQSELYYHMESIGSSLLAATYNDFLRFYTKIHPIYFGDALDVFASILKTKQWNHLYVEEEKRVVINEIKEHREMNIDDLFQKVYFEGTPLSKAILGTEASVKRITGKQLASYKKEAFNVNNMALFVSGPIQKSNLEQLENQLGSIDLPFGEKWTSNFKPKNFGNRNPDVTVVNQEWDLIDVDITFDVDIQRIKLYEIDVLNCILGGGIGSRLQMLLREKLGFVYDVSSFVEKYENFCLLRIQYTIDSNLFYQSYSALMQVLNQMKNDLNMRDLNTSLPFFTYNLNFNLDDTQENNFYNEYNVFVLNNNNYQCVMDYDEKSLHRLMNISNDLFKRENLSIICLGDCKDIEKNEIQNLSKVLNT